MKSCSKFSDHHIPLVLVMMKQATLSIPTKYRRQLCLKLSFIYSHTYTILPPLSPLIGKCKKSYRKVETKLKKNKTNLKESDKKARRKVERKLKEN